jgi:hypothetical protein
MIVRGQSVVNTTSLKGGMANEGVFKHELTSGFFVVEKITPKKNELILCKNAINANSLKTIPTIFEVVENKKTASVFMEHVDLLGYGFLAEEKAGARVARFIYDLHCELDFLRTPFFDNNNSQVKHLVSLEKLFYQNSDMVVVEKLRDMVKVFDEHGQVFSHNDLFLGNVGVREDGSLVAFDFGLVGMNFVGAELHHFFKRSPKMFFEELVGEYSKLLSLDSRIVLMGAILYEGIRQFERTKKGLDKTYCRAMLKDSVAAAHSALMVKFD